MLIVNEMSLVSDSLSEKMLACIYTDIYTCVRIYAFLSIYVFAFVFICMSKIAENREFTPPVLLTTRLLPESLLSVFVLYPQLSGVF